jgi:hypothetical protein
MFGLQLALGGKSSTILNLEAFTFFFIGSHGFFTNLASTAPFGFAQGFGQLRLASAHPLSRLCIARPARISPAGSTA